MVDDNAPAQPLQRRCSRASGEEIFSSPIPHRTSSEVRKSCSIVMQDNHVQLSGLLEKTADALGRSYRVLQKGVTSIATNDKNTDVIDEKDSIRKIDVKDTKPLVSGEVADRLGASQVPSAADMSRSVRHGTADGCPPLPKRHLSFDTSLKQRGQLHLQSADLFENFSPVQKERQLWRPTLPDAYSVGPIELVPVDAPELHQYDADELKSLHPLTFGQPCLEVHPCQSIGTMSPTNSRRPLRVGIVLSGGPAPGGHNVIYGLFDFIKESHPESQLFGFMGGLDGVFQAKYRVVNDDLMDRFRNQGGFDMLWSGRGRINGKEDLITAQKVCNELGLKGLIIVGGDGSQSNAALLSEYFAANLPSCSIIGVPKTIDGDLQNPWIETSFGFDTAAKTYSELIGNLCTDITTGQQVYHFVRVMGRSASHLVVECALQTRPNLVFVGEEVEAKNVTLKQIVTEIVDLIIARQKKGKMFGIVLVPEGLIEFIPEIKLLISELNALMSEHHTDKGKTSSSLVASRLTEASLEVWDFLPDSIQEQLLMDRESTGYIQVARIATERLLKLLTENELQRQDVWTDDLICMPHYFGYEGRCAMPSNFDANYCYSLGYTAGALVENRKNGYVSIARHLDQHPSMWLPGAVPFTRIMQIKQTGDGTSFPAVTRQLVNLKGPLFNVLCEVRDHWKLEDYYRCPGPIQFEGPVADIANYTVALPTKIDLLGDAGEPIVGTGKAVYPKRLGSLSPLQKCRLLDRPELPTICQDIHARAVPGSQYLPKDPFTQRQILLYYPYMCNNNQFHLQEVIQDQNTASVDPGLRVGVIFLSRQSPGVTNVLWGVHERLKIVRGKCLGFYGTDGLFEGRYLEITDQELELYLNQGGMELLGRAAVHSLLVLENQEKARLTCESLCLDGLVIVGSSLAMTEATLTAEYFLSKGCRTSVIGVPATGSNNLAHDLIETNIGFDTSSKVYASLIGNVLTDAASMPKYWHFVRLMGRQPSNEVLECALQTHPNVVIIAEEYGAANKTLWDVVMDIADVVCKRAEMGKNFGSVLIPDGLLSHLPNMKSLMNELASVVREADRSGQLKILQRHLDNIHDYDSKPINDSEWIRRITPWSLALFKSLPKFIRKELTQVDMGEMRFTLIETELLLSQMVQQELERRKSERRFSGKFAAVCHFFGYQGRSSMPSRFDAKLAFAFGHLASICVESGLTAHCCTVRGLCGETKDWKLGAIPFNSMLMFTAQQDDIHPDLRGKQSDLPIIPSAEVNLNGKAYRWMRTAVSQWQLQDRFCNPGPVQFAGKPSEFYHRMLHEEQAEYYNMLRHVQLYSRVLKDTCNFGVDEHFLKVVFANLNSLLALQFHSDDLMTYLPAFADVQQYEAWETIRGQRPEVWRMDGSSVNPSVSPIDRADTTTHMPFSTRPSIKDILTGIRLKSRSAIAGALGVVDEFAARGDGTPDSTLIRHTGSISPNTGAFVGRGASVTDAGWGNQPGVEAYPKSISKASPLRRYSDVKTLQ